ncbi:glycoside hydrolase [Nibricoccus aquaticus]|uniref:Glycoside hydrolase n=1 Tax=Nibricoccus aquaticus TaxID=2576891 RepID=A0A290QG74_9BACT|nr:glycoside hydrolase 43 family protein [Nibricoccus aquaticus]ATC65276.1 glycoside hydrolase [Nibricoccus aquaticus]
MIYLTRSLFTAMLATTVSSFAASTEAWVPDRGDGTYQNPVLHADYSDPDAVRVGDDYYMTASSFLAAPGLPILHSKDLVNWTLINHVFAVQKPAEHFSKPRHGQGVWAPSIRHHDGKFWIFYPDPDFGIYVTTAVDPAGKWSEPVLMKAGKGLIDPCPLWDDDGRLYLVHGWARSRAGIANMLTVQELSADGTRVLESEINLQTADGKTNDIGTVVIDANKLDGWRTLEGPKFYKRDGWYWVFAPAGGVATGYQAVFRSKNIRGPYEQRIVLEQGKTPINGPHQGAWVTTPDGKEDWFLHFQDKGAYGRVVHLQPMWWRDDGWPVMGSDPESDGKGEPVLTHAKPNVGRTWPVAVPATTDEFNAPKAGLQWQWNANPREGWASLTAKAGALRLASVPAPATRNDDSAAKNSLYDAPNFYVQKFPAPAFTATTVLDFAPVAEGEMAGLAVFGFNYAVLGLRKQGEQSRLVLLTNIGADAVGAQHRETASAEVPAGPVYLRVTVGADAMARFAYSLDDVTFTPIGEAFKAREDRWIGAKFGLIATAPSDATATGHADFDWFRVTAPVR